MLLGMRQSLASSPVVQALFAAASNDYTTLSTTSSMPTGGLITRAGNAMLYDSTGKLTYAPNNLAQQSGDVSAAFWASGFDAGNTTTSTSINFTSASGYRLAPFSSGIAVGQTYIFSVVMSSGTKSTANIRLYDSGGGAGANSNFTLTSTPTRYSVVWTTTNTPTTIYFGWDNRVAAGGDGTTGTINVSQMQVERVTYQTTPSTYVATTSAAYYGPRFDYDPATLAAKGLLVEGTRTNLTLYSQDFSNAYWTKSATITPTYNAYTSPDGTLNASRFASTTQFDSVSRSIGSLTVGSTYTFSMWVRWVSGSTTLYLNIDEGGANVNRTQFTATSTWQRITVSRTITSGTATVSVQNREVTASTFECFGSQLELGAFATSYIPTVASSVARAAETFTLANYQNRLVESFYIDEQTGGSWSANINASATSPLTISTPTFGWVTSLRAYTNAYAGDISTPSWIDNSGTTGNRMYYDSTGMLTYAPANLVLQSQTFDSGSWTKSFLNTSGSWVDVATAPDGTLTADKLIENNSSNIHYATQSITAYTPATKIYVVSAYFKASERTYATLGLTDISVGTRYAVAVFNLSNGTVSTSGASDTGYAVSAQTPISVGNGWYRCFVQVTVGASAPFLTIGIGVNKTGVISVAAGGMESYAGDNTSGIFVWGAQLEQVTYQVSPKPYIPTTSAAVYQPRYDYDPRSVLQGTGTVSTNTIVFPATFNDGSTCSAVNSYYNGQYVTIGGSNFTITGYVGSTRTATLSSAPAATGSQAFTLGNPTWLTPRGMLIEEQRVNLVTYSQSASNWTIEGTRVGSSTTSPDGTTNANLIIPTTANSGHKIYPAIVSVTNGETYTMSCYAKAGGYNYCAIWDGVTGSTVKYDLIAGKTNGTSGATGTITPVGSGWYRLTATMTAGSSIMRLDMFVLQPGSQPPNTAFVGDDVNGIYFWGAQLEAGSFATSYIPTTTGSVTRVADVVKLSGSALTTWQGSAGTAIVEYNRYADRYGAYDRLMFADNNSVATYNMTYAMYVGQDEMWSSGVNQINYPYAGQPLNTNLRNALSWQANNTNAAFNGSVQTTDTSVTLPTGINAAYLGNYRDNTYAAAYFRSVALYNQRLPNAILAQKSTVGAPY